MTLGALSAQSQESTLVTGGTTYDSPNGGRWAYLFWRTEDPTAFLSTGTFGTSTFVIYAKSGAPNSVAPYAKVTDVSLQNNTPAVAALETAGVPYTLHTVEVDLDAGGGAQGAEAHRLVDPGRQHVDAVGGGIDAERHHHRRQLDTAAREIRHILEYADVSIRQPAYRANILAP
jgi:hypothetical protein